MKSIERCDAAFGSKSSDEDFGLCYSEAIFFRCRKTGLEVLQMGSNGVENAPMGDPHDGRGFYAATTAYNSR